MAAKRTASRSARSTKKASPKGGRPEHHPTKQTRLSVAALYGCGMTKAEVASSMGITEPTLRKHYRDELASGAAKVQAKLVSKMLNLATGKDTPPATALKAATFMLRTRFNWSEFSPPRPTQPEPRKPAPGKKEAADIAAKDGHENTSWGDVIH